MTEARGAGQPTTQKAEAAEDTESAVVTVTEYAIAPVDFVGHTVEGRAQVTDVISDRGFWMTVDDMRVLGVVREDVPRHEMIDIDAGDTIEFSGLALEAEMMDELTGTLEQELEEAIQGEPGFVAMHWKDVKQLDSAKTGN